MKDNSRGHLPMKFFLADFMASAVTLQETSFDNKNLHGKVAMDIVFQRKKQNSNRAEVVEVLSILTKVKNAKKGNFVP
jgi:hypothetical protein